MELLTRRAGVVDRDTHRHRHHDHGCERGAGEDEARPRPGATPSQPLGVDVRTERGGRFDLLGGALEESYRALLFLEPGRKLVGAVDLRLQRRAPLGWE